MSAKKKINIDTLIEQDEVLIALKDRYFKISVKEDFGKTPQLTNTLDKLEGAINKRKEELKNA